MRLILISISLVLVSCGNPTSVSRQSGQETHGGETSAIEFKKIANILSENSGSRIDVAGMSVETDGNDSIRGGGQELFSLGITGGDGAPSAIIHGNVWKKSSCSRKVEEIQSRLFRERVAPLEETECERQFSTKLNSLDLKDSNAVQSELSVLVAVNRILISISKMKNQPVPDVAKLLKIFDNTEFMSGPQTLWLRPGAQRTALNVKAASKQRLNIIFVDENEWAKSGIDENVGLVVHELYGLDDAKDLNYAYSSAFLYFLYRHPEFVK